VRAADPSRDERKKPGAEGETAALFSRVRDVTPFCRDKSLDSAECDDPAAFAGIFETGGSCSTRETKSMRSCIGKFRRSTRRTKRFGRRERSDKRELFRNLPKRERRSTLEGVGARTRDCECNSLMEREEVRVVRAVQHILFADVNARSGIDFASGLVPLLGATVNSSAASDDSSVAHKPAIDGTVLHISATKMLRNGFEVRVQVGAGQPKQTYVNLRNCG
jgi:hypothetical protein